MQLETVLRSGVTIPTVQTTTVHRCFGIALGKESIMGDTHIDPIDHSRTALPHSGATFKDAYLLPGVALLALSVVATALGLASAGYMHPEWSAVIALGALLFGALGIVVITVERRRVGRIDAQWHARPMTRTPR
jgi:uncharacterized membrane protein YcjF (UPF0283 family)